MHVEGTQSRAFPLLGLSSHFLCVLFRDHAIDICLEKPRVCPSESLNGPDLDKKDGSVARGSRAMEKGPGKSGR